MEHGITLAELVKLNDGIDIKKIIRPGDTIQVTGERKVAARTVTNTPSSRQTNEKTATDPIKILENQMKSIDEQIAQTRNILNQENLTSE